MQGKLDEERTKLTEFQNTASVLQEEFEVYQSISLYISSDSGFLGVDHESSGVLSPR